MYEYDDGIPKEYRKLHKLCFNNKELLIESKKCVCMYCGKRFDVSEIEEWIEDWNETTALCPSCGIDSVIPAVVEGRKITDDIVKELERFYF